MAANCLLQCLDTIRTRMQEDFRRCSGEVQAVRQSAANFGPPEPVQRLMGQMQSLWE